MIRKTARPKALFINERRAIGVSGLSANGTQMAVTGI